MMSMRCRGISDIASLAKSPGHRQQSLLRGVARAQRQTRRKMAFSGVIAAESLVSR
jgi:hypothetical protein